MSQFMLKVLDKIQEEAVDEITLQENILDEGGLL